VSAEVSPLSHGSGLYGLAHLFAGGRQVVLPGFEPQDVLEAFEALPNVTICEGPLGAGWAEAARYCVDSMEMTR